MNEITVIFTEDEARALLPRKGHTDTAAEWNRRIELAESAQRKIKVAVRKQAAPERPREQETLGGLAA